MKKLKGKVAFVTGGSRGIGAAIAQRLSYEGADVIFTHSGKNNPKAAEVLKHIKSNDVKGDALIAKSEDMQALLKALETTLKNYGSIDILVNNAGIYMQKAIEEYTPEEFDEITNVNIKAVFIASQFVARHMKSGGRIITIGSNMADRVAFPGGSLYAMSKSALTGLTKGMARDVGARNITVNLIQPGPVDTDMNPANSAHAPMITNAMAINRYASVDEIAGLAAYLSSEESQFITGASITIDGGFNI